MNHNRYLAMSVSRGNKNTDDVKCPHCDEIQ